MQNMLNEQFIQGYNEMVFVLGLRPLTPPMVHEVVSCGSSLTDVAPLNVSRWQGSRHGCLPDSHCSRTYFAVTTQVYSQCFSQSQ